MLPGFPRFTIGFWGADMKFAKLCQGLAVAAAVMFSAQAARAVTYNFDFTDITTTQIGNLVITAPAIGGTATGVAGTFGGVGVTGLSNFGGADNVLSLTSPYVSYNGFSFVITGGENFNLYYNGSSLLLLNSIADPSGIGLNPDYVSVSGFASESTAVPEPASMVLLIAGVAGLGAMRRRRV
jgi:hypothetical protein